MKNDQSSATGRSPADPPFGIAPPGYRLPDGIRLGPVRLQVADVARSEAFYERVLGLVARSRTREGVSLGAPGGREPLVELIERPGAMSLAPRSRLGLFHFALLLPSRADLAAFALHADALGVPLGSADHHVSEALYLSDPDGLGIEVYADRARERWRSSDGQVVMTTDPLDAPDLLAQARPAPFAGVPRGTRMGHVHVHVGDLEGAARFYHEALGFDKVAWNYPGALFLSAGGYHHHVGTNVWAGRASPAGPNEARLLSWTLVLPDEVDIENTVRSLESAGLGVLAGTERLLVDDPWGTTVELVSGAKPSGPTDGGGP